MYSVNRLFAAIDIFLSRCHIAGMAVYIARVGDTGPVKIGYSNKIEDRLKAFVPISPYRLVLLRELDGTRRAEAWLHDRFAHCAIEREWFEFDPDMLTIELPDPIPDKQTERQKETVALREAGKSYRAIGGILGVSRQTVLNDLRASGRDDLCVRPKKYNVGR